MMMISQKQDDLNGYHVVQQDKFMYCGFIQDGIPNGFGSILWPDGSEYHGEMKGGRMHGEGLYVFQDRRQFRGKFEGGNPVSGRMRDEAGALLGLTFDGAQPIWEEPTPVQRDELPARVLPEFRLDTCASILLSHAQEQLPPPPQLTPHHYRHMRDVSARVVWARPSYADVPLWNAAEVRGKIVAVLRGPKPPARAVPYNIKVLHAQQAGAAGVVLVDPEITTEPLIARVHDEPAVKIVIPVCATVNTPNKPRGSSLLVNDAMVSMVFAPLGLK
ncbi:hypothetical protein GUITHDRAFT_110959 [Guillardia theta CCMP2712]|uniref:PA domain-containing protein n=1 Tax=Guillardia theta (strain CCMP2712) TaxID=905079 RepID=L1J308_GUITC|nr:hypothetical protein GUITHDRAFT_110959 [Guillardia theta CCMP2712]EKX42908.1 hypothetical protein GUITHDRAFT_110959 [Guillardia theta CCMP2712]|eukprot:XP_005829888.1 hypothetical protein GUITHDRAFT_110959 [Guillardia theta CCMP2712]